jgi:signal transduction histidine kinase
VRSSLVLASSSARILVNDLEAAFVSELLVRSSATSADSVPSFAKRAHLNADNAGLRVTVRELGPEAGARYADLNNRLTAFDAMPHDGPALTAQRGLELLASAERLDSLFGAMSGARRAQVERLERIDLVTPLILAPVALVAIIIVMWTGRQTLLFARLAEEERAHVFLAAEARAALLRGVTHDVKNPLGAAVGFTQLLEDGIIGPLAEPQLEIVHRIHRLVQTSVEAITDLLELSRAEGELAIDLSASDLALIVSEVVGDHRGLAGEKGVDVVVTTPPTPLMTDPRRARQIIANLLSNAIKYTPAGGQVRVAIVGAVSNPDSGALVGVEVRDTGPGIRAELHGRVFEEFFRAESAGARTPDGNGVGLAFSRRMARLLGGDITLATAPSGGAVFTAWFKPAATQPRAA